MDNLKFVSSWRGGIQGSKLPIKLGGIQLEGCSFDGTRLSENQHDSPSVSAIPPCAVAWVTKVCVYLFSCFFLTLDDNSVNTLGLTNFFLPAISFPEILLLCGRALPSSLI